jgi:phosphatidylethanolamine-binding protein (PEBP) family uncharacterized protein
MMRGCIRWRWASLSVSPMAGSTAVSPHRGSPRPPASVESRRELSKLTRRIRETTNEAYQASRPPARASTGPYVRAPGTDVPLHRRIRRKAARHAVFPDVLPDAFVPSLQLDVRYAGPGPAVRVRKGHFLPPAVAAGAPVVHVMQGASLRAAAVAARRLYTLLMVTPDSPAAESLESPRPRGSEVVHWLVANIPAVGAEPRDDPRAAALAAAETAAAAAARADQAAAAADGGGEDGDEDSVRKKKKAAAADAKAAKKAKKAAANAEAAAAESTTALGRKQREAKVDVALDLAAGKELFPYLPPNPRKGADYRGRYVFLLFEHDAPLSARDALVAAGRAAHGAFLPRADFNSFWFVERYQLRPVGLSFFVSGWDDSVPAIYSGEAAAVRDVKEPAADAVTEAMIRRAVFKPRKYMWNPALW